MLKEEKMKVLLLHGWFSTGDVKHGALLNMGHDVIKPSLNNFIFSSAVKAAQNAFDQYNPDVIVGSSRGGAVALNMKSGNTPLLLIAPAWKYFGSKNLKLKDNIWVLHSPHDETIPYANSQELISLNPNINLHTVGYDHQLNCSQGYKTMKNILETIQNTCANKKAS